MVYRQGTLSLGWDSEQEKCAILGSSKSTYIHQEDASHTKNYSMGSSPAKD
jgi:hypothetical protein